MQPESLGDVTRCYSCGKLGHDECSEFDTQDPKQIKVCAANETCLLYTWEKSERGAIGTNDYLLFGLKLKECFDPIKDLRK